LSQVRCHSGNLPILLKNSKGGVLPVWGVFQQYRSMPLKKSGSEAMRAAGQRGISTGLTQFATKGPLQIKGSGRSFLKLLRRAGGVDVSRCLKPRRAE